MAATKKSRGKSRAKFRASWRGQLRFGLVSFEVQAVNAEIKENAEVHFHLLHSPDKERIHFAKMCPKHGAVPNNEIVEGEPYYGHAGLDRRRAIVASRLNRTTANLFYRRA
jgi:hypothetical protein